MFSSLREQDAMGGYTGGNTTGFVSPANDSLEGPIDLVGLLDMSRPSRYPVRVAGDALAGRGILSGDILIADAATPSTSGRVAIVMFAGDVLVAQLVYRDSQWWLRSGMAAAPAVPIGEDAEIWAIVTGLVRTIV
jgi:DNA polymerase V